MALTPYGWSVVVIGKWNPAILTPAGVNKHVFKLHEDTPLSVQIALDGYSPYKVGLPDEDIFTVVDSNQLLLDIVNKDFLTLEKGKKFAINALQGLPETPIRAAGWNVNYKNTEVSSMISSVLTTDIDNAFSDENFSISARRLGRTFKFHNGVINMMLTRVDTDGYTINLNFHKNSQSSADLKKWLEIPITEVEKVVKKFIKIFEEEVLEV